MNELMELNEINERDERTDALRGPEPSPVQRRIGKPVKLSSVLASVKNKIKFPQKTKKYRQIGFKDEDGYLQCFKCDAQHGGKLYKSPIFGTFTCSICGDKIKSIFAYED